MIVDRVSPIDYDLYGPHWLGAVRRVEGSLRLIATGAPLTDQQQQALAENASKAIGETVQP